MLRSDRITLFMYMYLKLNKNISTMVLSNETSLFKPKIKIFNAPFPFQSSRISFDYWKQTVSLLVTEDKENKSGILYYVQSPIASDRPNWHTSATIIVLLIVRVSPSTKCCVGRRANRRHRTVNPYVFHKGFWTFHTWNDIALQRVNAAIFRGNA